jgi:hypothetical protein
MQAAVSLAVFGSRTAHSSIQAVFHKTDARLSKGEIGDIAFLR